MLGTRGVGTSLGRVRRSRLTGSALGAVLGVVLGAASLASCESNAAPPPLESPTPSPSATSRPTPAAPELPAEARGTTEASAKAFAEHYVDLINYAMNSGDVTALRALGDEACVSCRAISSNIDDTYSSGGKISSRGWLLQSVSVVPNQPAHRPILDLGIVMSPERIVRRTGAKQETFPGGKQPMTMYLRHAKGGWLVVRLDRVA